MPRPGSLAWLVAWDLRLARRGFGRRPGAKATSDRTLMLTTLSLFAFMHVLGASVSYLVRLTHPGDSAQLLLLTTAVCFAIASAVAGALSVSVNLLFVRNDLELLCSTPVPTRSIFTARSLSIALRSVASPALLLLPVANLGVFLDGPRWLAAYPVALATGLSASTIGLTLTLVLVRTLGARAARTIALVLSMLLGAGVFLALQATNILDKEQKRVVFSAMAHWLNTSPAAAPDSWVWYPARAVRGEWMPLAATMVAGLLLFQLSAWLLPRGFSMALRQSAQVTSTGRIRTSPFRAHFIAVLFAKEWRTLYRDPLLLTQLLQRLIGLAPGIFLMLQRYEEYSATAKQASLVASLTVLVGMLADTLVWLAVCADDAPELLASAPRPASVIRRAKLLAMLLPVWVAALALLVALAWQSPWLLFCAIVCVGGMTTSVGMFHLWNPIQISRKDIRQRHQRSVKATPGRAIASLTLYIAWGAFAWFLTSREWWFCLAALPLALAGPVYSLAVRNEAA